MIIQDLVLRRTKDNPVPPAKKAVLCILDLDDYNAMNGELLLRENDREHLDIIKSPRRIREFSLGRAAAYTAINRFFNGEPPSDLLIQRGVFGQPFLSSCDNSTPEISIAHSSGMAAVVVFSEGQQLSVDIEELRAQPGRLDAIRSSLVDGEESLVRRTGRGAVEALYTLWTLKEGLGKVLKTGITTPLELFEISRVESVGKGLVCYFKNFHQYKTFSRTLENKAVYSIIHPLYTSLEGLDSN